MLAKRTNLLLEKVDYYLLKRLAQQQDVSMGELIRQAIDKTYKEQFISEQRQKNVAAIKQLWQQAAGKRINYKSLIEDGRKL